MEVEIISREAIKPCSKTPKHLRIVKLSMLDQISPDVYVPIILFYPFNNKYHIIISQQIQNPIEIAFERSQRLKETLAKALDLYYPFAGRIRNNLFVECNDEGVVFVEAKSSIFLSEILKNPHRDLLTNFISAQPESELEFHGGSLLLVQATIFDCGGIALGLSFSHKLADACTIGAFLKAWTEISRRIPEPRDRPRKPLFSQGCDIFPSILDPLTSEYSYAEYSDREKFVTRRFVFSPEKISALKTAARNKYLVRNPTRVEAVSGLLWKCATKYLHPNSSSIWFTAMNMRKRLSPPLEENSAGNLLSGFSAKTKAFDDDNNDNDLPILVDKLRKSFDEAKEKYSKKERVLWTVHGELLEIERAVNNGCERGLYSCASWLGFEIYGSDFGWEKPSWVSFVCSDEFENLVVLIDGRDNGIEAWLVLREDHMACVETDLELLAFASLNPSVL